MVHSSALPFGSFPSARLRRTRQAGWVRELTRETRLSPADLIWPVFVQEGEGLRTPVPSLPGVSRLSLEALVEDAREAQALGIPAIALFPVVPAEKKDEMGSEALNPDNLVCRALRRLKRDVPGLGLIADVALDPYTSHGMDGILLHGEVANDETVDILCRQAVVQAEAGCDIVAPSDMMDGRIGAIRASLDAKNHANTLILSYAAKYASSLYGPFREAVDSAASLGKADKKTFQMNPANAVEALREAALDLEEGADMLMVKPALPYLDIVFRLSELSTVPVLAYQVSGEYAMACSAPALNRDAVLMEMLTACKRAGARAILTYAAIDIARRLQS